jgi:hypothetical protein
MLPGKGCRICLARFRIPSATTRETICSENSDESGRTNWVTSVSRLLTTYGNKRLLLIDTS